MAHITLYLDNDSEKLLRQKAQRSHMSLSRWAAKVLKEKTRGEWSEEVNRLAGAWQDLDSARQMRTFPVADVPREEL